jgi:hypothetical protein
MREAIELLQISLIIAVEGIWRISSLNKGM